MYYKVDASKVMFTTDSLYIRGICMGDFDNFKEYLMSGGKSYSDDRIKEMFNDTLTKNDTLGIFKNNELVGALVFATFDNEYNLINDSKIGVGIGYSVKQSMRNQGIMSEAVVGFIGYCFESLKLDFIYGACALDNKASYRVLEKCGFKWYKSDDEQNHFVIWGN